jgi:coenzyme Q-binding protein COQ10
MHRVRHSAADMFDLVADVERYPEFVPFCRHLKVRERLPEPEGVEVLVADMTVDYKVVRETFTSRVTLDRPNLQILVEYLEGPFSRLENRWAFHATGERASDVEFFIVYEFKSRTLGLLMGAMFDVAFRRMAAAFERRADQIYAK